MNPRCTYFCVDVEANGPVPGLYDMVSLGACSVKPDSNGRLKIAEKLYLEIRPQAPRFDARAAAVHGLDQDRLHREGLPRAEACRQLSAWVKKHTIEGSEAVFVGHNAPFDWAHVSWCYAAENIPNPFGYKAMCTKSVSMGVMNLNWIETSKETLQEMLGLPKEDKNLKHRADYDAEYQALMLIALLNRIEATP